MPQNITFSILNRVVSSKSSNYPGESKAKNLPKRSYRKRTYANKAKLIQLNKKVNMYLTCSSTLEWGKISVIFLVRHSISLKFTLYTLKTKFNYVISMARNKNDNVQTFKYHSNHRLICCRNFRYYIFIFITKLNINH